MSTYSKTAKLPKGYSVDLNFVHPYGLTLEWMPDIPPQKLLNKDGKFHKAYCKARDEFLTEVATATGQRIMVADLGGTVVLFTPQTKQ